MDDTTHLHKAPFTQGFTLVELIVVMVIVAVLAGTGLYVWQGNAFTPSIQVAELATDLRYAQALAMNRRRLYQVKLTASSYQLTDEHDVANSFAATGSTVNLHNGLSMTYTNLPNDTVFFNGFGEPMSDSSTTLSNAAVITISATNGTTATITINPQTGLIDHD